MGKILCYTYDTMADFEIVLASQMLSDAEKEVIAFGNEIKTYKGLSNLHIQATLTIKEAMELDDIDGILLPGGWERECKEDLLDLIKKLYEENKLIAAICAAPEFLAKAGILKNHHYTTTLTEERIKEKGIEDIFPRENFLSERVVVDKNVITAIGSAYREFGLSLLDYFNSFESEDERKSYIELYKG